MASDCVFCLIGSGKIPSHKVVDEPTVLAFLDIKPLARGHALVIPKAHYATLEEVPPREAAELMKAVQKVSQAARRAVSAPATTIAVNNGKEAGQEVPHIHFHVVPRFVGDGFGPIHALFRSGSPPKQDDLGGLANSMQELARRSR